MWEWEFLIFVWPLWIPTQGREKRRVGGMDEKEYRARTRFPWVGTYHKNAARLLR